jgi:hypothetical protein
LRPAQHIRQNLVSGIDRDGPLEEFDLGCHVADMTGNATAQAEQSQVLGPGREALLNDLKCALVLPHQRIHQCQVGQAGRGWRSRHLIFNHRKRTGHVRIPAVEILGRGLRIFTLLDHKHIVIGAKRSDPVSSWQRGPILLLPRELPRD